jgi:hypothetical protein
VCESDVGSGRKEAVVLLENGANFYYVRYSCDLTDSMTCQVREVVRNV